MFEQLKEERQRRGSALALTRTKGKNSSGGGEKEEGEFDDLISALRTGDVFGEDMAKLNKVRNRRGRPNAPTQVLIHGNKNTNKSPRENGLTTRAGSGIVSRERLGPQSKLSNST